MTDIQYPEYVKFFRIMFQNISETWRQMPNDLQENYINELYSYGVRIGIDCPKCRKRVTYEEHDTEIVNIINGAHTLGHLICTCGWTTNIYISPLTRKDNIKNFSYLEEPF